ncbi:MULTISPECIES: hypothetical protein [Microbacterium]|uniref:beta strand repeat-containing protein n=1 Tax=Microbacterium TaxID=33882 RepID=UPI0027800B16|nr:MULTISPECIES: hypothetical protein [Microbacterium]MDQ1074643.1 hypothetical protein [Microbacterium sp. SORGH_AS_0969]MDQ1114867.1 hypothetical protein [Microbacterium testaceum]
MENTPEFPAVDAGLPRRTVLTGAAWTIPVIAAATIAPAASASGTLQLAFDKSTYNGTACSTITGAYVTATTNGVPTTGASITVSLSNNYTFSGGSTTATGYSDTNGRYTLPDINVAAAGGTAAVTATSGSSTGTATLSAPAVPDEVPQDGSVALTGLPAGVTATQIARQNTANGGVIWVRGSDNNLYGVTRTSTAVTTLTRQFTNANSFYSTPNSDAIGWITTSGTPMDGSVALTGLPAGVTATQIARQNTANGGVIWVRGSDNNLYGVTRTSTAVTTLTRQFTNANSFYSTPNSDAIGWITTSGTPMDGSVALTGLPAGVTATQIARQNTANGGVIWVRGSDNNLYGVTRTSTAVTTLTRQFTNANSFYSTPNSDAIGWITTSGTPMDGSVALTGLPAGVTATQIARQNTANGGVIWVRGSDNNLYGVTRTSTAVTTLTRQFTNANSFYSTPNSDAIGWITTSGTPMDGSVALTGLPAGVTATQIARQNTANGGVIWVRGSDNNLYGVTRTSTAVTTLTRQFTNANSFYSTPNSDAIGWITTSGTPMDGSVALTGLPAGVTATQIARQNTANGGVIWVRGSDNNLYGVTRTSTAVTTLTRQFTNANSFYSTPNSDAIGWIAQAACS